MEVGQELDEAVVVLHVLQPDLLQRLDLHLTVDAEEHLDVDHAPFRGNDACNGRRRRCSGLHHTLSLGAAYLRCFRFHGL